MNLYLDTSALKRPFDDQTQPRIALETDAIVAVLAMVQSGEATLIGSSALEYENERNPQPERLRWTRRVLELANEFQMLTSPVQERADILEREGLKPLDALHAASAEAANADFLLTCDDRLVRRYAGPLQVLNPVQFILRVTEQR